jgi:chemotaxis protein CheD
LFEKARRLGLNGMLEIQVGIAEFKVGREPAVIVTLGLGSCVGVTLYDGFNRVGGLLHVMLPRVADFTRGAHKPAKFADLGIPVFLKEVLKTGADRRFLEAKIAGGAQMFTGADRKFELNIGERNIEAVRETLKTLKIRIVAEDVGGSKGRTMMLHTVSGRVIVRMLGSQVKEI